MEIQYFQGTWGDKPLIRGDLDDWLSFAQYNSKTQKWDKSKNTFWSHDILVDNGPYIDLTEEQAQEIINEHIRKGD